MDNVTRIEEQFSRIDNIDNSIVDATNMRLRRLVRKRKTYIRNEFNQDPYEYYEHEEFKRRFRFTKDSVQNVILPLIDRDLQSSYLSNRGLPLANRLKLLIALRFYATGSFQTVCADIVTVSQPTVCRVVAQVSAALARQLPRYIRFPGNNQQLMLTKQKFEEMGRSQTDHGINNIVAAIDCTHIKISRPRNIPHSEAYRNRKGNFSINTQVVVGPNMEIFDISVRWPGSTHDSRILRNSSIYMRFLRRNIEGIMVGDSGYPSLPFLLTPLIEPVTRAERKYNYAHIKTRNIVERVFGVWKRKFPCLQLGLRTKLKTSANIIVACAVLHNIGIINNDSFEVENQGHDHRETGDTRSYIPSSAEGLAMRQAVIAQFN